MLERLRAWRIDRLTDPMARKPHGRPARLVYGARDVHIVLTTPPGLVGTPATPYPLASRGHFLSDRELGQLPLTAGFAESRVVRTDVGGQLLVSRP